MKVYNDAGVLEKVLKDKRMELGPVPDEEDMGSPKLKLSRFAPLSVLSPFICIVPFFYILDR